MKTYAVVVSKLVQEQIREAVFYIAHDSVENALAWEDRLEVAIAKIGVTPGGYPVDAATSERVGVHLRKLVFERTFLLFYRVNDANRTVELVNFRHGASLPRTDEP